MNKQNMALLSLTKGMEIETCYLDEPWKHGAKWNKPDTKGQVLYYLP